MKKLLLTLLLVVAGCSDTIIDPFDNDGRYYTIWGYLDGNEINHSVRVTPVTRFPESILGPAEPQAFLDGRVFSIDQTTGEEIEWEHNLLKLDDGTFGHVFNARFQPRGGRTYRLEVRRSDGKMAWAETTVPTVRSVIQEPETAPEMNELGELVLPFVAPGVVSPWEIRVMYQVQGPVTNRRMYVSQGRVGERSPDGWAFTINLTRDQPNLIEQVRADQAAGIMPNDTFGLGSMGVWMRSLDDSWVPPDGTFDPEVLAQPGVLSNVENGFGYWGSVGMFIHEWTLDQDLVTALGWPLPAN